MFNVCILRAYYKYYFVQLFTGLGYEPLNSRFKLEKLHEQPLLALNKITLFLNYMKRIPNIAPCVLSYGKEAFTIIKKMPTRKSIRQSFITTPRAESQWCTMFN